MKNQDIIITTDIVVHIINLKDIDNILNEIGKNIEMTNNDNKHILQSELTETKNKLYTLYGNHNRERRGLINVVGSSAKWLFGTMDDEDRKEVENHISTFKENMQETDEALNKQIYINTYFNDTIKYIEQIVKSDREAIERQLNAISKFENNRYQENLYYDQQIKIQLIKNKIEHLQDNVASARYNILHPSILTDHEIKKYNIDFNKLNHIKLATAMFRNNLLVFAIEIPKNFITVKIQQIIPMPNEENFEIDQESELIFNYKNSTYTYKTNKKLKEMRKSKHCVFKKNCKLIQRNEMQILELDEETVVIKNAKNETLYQNCNSNEIKMKKNILIHFTNCTIGIENNYFTNSYELDKKRILYEKSNQTQNFTKQITFEKILENNKINWSNIRKLKTHKDINYFFNATILLSIIVLIAYIVLKHKKIKIQLNNNRIQENSYLKGGEVTYNPTSLPTYVQNPISSLPPLNNKVQELLNSLNAK